MYVVNLTIPKSYSCSVVITLSPTIRSHFISSLISLIKASFSISFFSTLPPGNSHIKGRLIFSLLCAQRILLSEKIIAPTTLITFFIRLTLQFKIILIVILSKITKLYINQY
ncbi:DNA mismatch repair protein MutT [Staphylococcus aureus]|nr:DNA mismatch repair protein MutT [Staphylococcus aureus]